MTGFDPVRPELSDIAMLLAAQGLPVSAATIEASSPWRYRDAVSADMAAHRARRPLPFQELVDFSRAPAGPGLNLIEGIGGVMAPLDDGHTVLDWIAALDADVLLVAGSYLGSLSHALTALAALESRSRTPVAIVLSQSESEPVPTAESAATLRNFVGDIPVLIVPRGGQANAAELAALLQDWLVSG
jgi:dethiobiotin synthetase